MEFSHNLRPSDFVRTMALVTNVPLLVGLPIEMDNYNSVIFNRISVQKINDSIGPYYVFAIRDLRSVTFGIGKGATAFWFKLLLRSYLTKFQIAQ